MKRIKCCVIIFLLILISIMQSGCTFNYGSGSTEKTDTVMIDPNSIMPVSYQTHPDKKVNDSIESFFDGYYNYFYFKIGEVSGVPIYQDTKKRYQGIGEATYTFGSTEITETTITETVTETLSNSVELAIEEKMENTIVKDVMAIGLKQQVSSKLTSTSSKELVTSVKNTVSSYKEYSYKLTKDCPSGYYRFTIYATCEVYAALKCDVNKKTATCVYIPLVNKNTCE